MDRLSSKLFLALIFSSTFTSASANTGLHCKVMLGLAETVTLTQTNVNTFHVSHYGHSRNTYSAEYYAPHHGTTSGYTRYGSLTVLNKVKDFSTWKDMPQKLYLKEYHLGNYYRLEGGGFNVTFNEKNCK